MNLPDKAKEILVTMAKDLKVIIILSCTREINLKWITNHREEEYSEIKTLTLKSTNKWLLKPSMKKLSKECIEVGLLKVSKVMCWIGQWTRANTIH
jgi:(p)ppGpp synthase/HD superfamily hydrolase